MWLGSSPGRCRSNRFSTPALHLGQAELGLSVHFGLFEIGEADMLRIARVIGASLLLQ
jgi:hypothetical protein